MQPVIVIWTALTAVVSLLLCLNPLTGTLDWEFSQAIAIWAVVGALVCPVNAQRRTLRHPLFWLGLSLGVPLLLVTLNALRIPQCDWGRAFAWYLVLPVISGGLALILRAGCTRLAGARGGRLLFGLLAGLLLARSLAAIALDPPLFAINALWGYFPGPIYDEELPLGAPLLMARLHATGWLLLLAGLLKRRPREPWGGWAVVAILGLGILAYGWIAGESRLRVPDREEIRRELGLRMQAGEVTIWLDRELARKGPDWLRPLGLEVVWRYERMERFFGGAPPRPPQIYLYADSRRKKQLIGAGGTRYADIVNGELHIHGGQLPPRAFDHELAHLFTERLHPDWWGLSLRRFGLVEGVAVAAETALGRENPNRTARIMLDEDRLPPITELLPAWGFWRHSSSIAYKAMGGFVLHLYERCGGIEAVGALLRGAGFAEVCGRDLGELEAGWHEELRKVRLDTGERERKLPGVRRRSIFTKPCARSLELKVDDARALVRQGEFDAARERLVCVLEDDPRRRDALGTMIALAERQTDTRAALERLRALQARPQLDEDLRMLLHQRIALDRWVLEGPEAMREEWEKIPAVWWDAGDRRRRALIEAVLEPEAPAAAAPALQRYLMGDVSRTELARHAETDETQLRWVWEYLLGRNLESRDNWREAAVYLQRALEADALNEDADLATETRLSLGRALYFTARYRAAAEVFRQLQALAAPDDLRSQRIGQWIERCEWAAENAADWRFEISRVGAGDASEALAPSQTL